jgi:uncharacterized protein YdeI (YjbR/CyaY-like superfamily)
MTTVELHSRGDWRAWLEAHHATAENVWLVTYKKAARKPTISYEEAVEEALCFGWIDSKSKAVDDERTSMYFAPRKAKSNWTEGNVARVEKLIAEGKMAPAGLAAYGRRE